MDRHKLKTFLRLRGWVGLVFLAAAWLSVPLNRFTVSAGNNGFLILPGTTVADRVPVTNSTTIGDITWKQVPNAALLNPSVTVNGTTCTLGSSCSPSGGISGPLYSQVANETVNAAGATTLTDATGAQGSLTLASTVLNTAGNVLHVYASGVYSSAVTPGTATLRIRLASTDVCTGTFTPTAQANGAPWWVDIYITSRVPGATGTLMCNGSGVFTDSTTAALKSPPLNDNANAFDTTGTLAFDITWQWNTHAAGDSITLTNLILSEI